MVLSHIGLLLMSIGTFSHGWGQSGPLRTRGGGVRGWGGGGGEDGLRGYLRRGQATPELTHHTAIPSSSETPPKIILPPPSQSQTTPYTHTQQPSLVKFSFFGHSQKGLGS